jgi:AraC family transcriptional regulator, arabinose operon regulatory protein
MAENDKILYCGYSFHKQPFRTSTGSQGLSHYLFRLQTEGLSQALVNGKLTKLVPGHLLVYKPGDPYELRIEPHWNELGQSTISSGDYYILCRGDWIDSWYSQAAKPQLNRINLDDKLISLWRHLILESRRLEDKDEELTCYLLRSLCLTIDRTIRETSTPQGRSFTALRMKNFIAEHAATPFKIEDVAKYAGISVSRAVHLFKECYGTTMIRYAQEVRMAAALERIQYSTMTLEQIAESSGFASYTYFHRVFREKYKMSPSEYRASPIAPQQKDPI